MDFPDSHDKRRDQHATRAWRHDVDAQKHNTGRKHNKGVWSLFDMTNKCLAKEFYTRVIFTPTQNCLLVLLFCWTAWMLVDNFYFVADSECFNCKYNLILEYRWGSVQLSWLQSCLSLPRSMYAYIVCVYLYIVYIYKH